MARPLKFYVIYARGEAVAIAHGAAEARHIARTYGGSAGQSIKTEQAAQERAAWHNYLAYRPGGHLYHLTVDSAGQALA